MTDAEIMFEEALAEYDRELDEIVFVDPQCRTIQANAEHAYKLAMEHGEFSTDTSRWWDKLHVRECVRCARHTDLHRRGGKCPTC
jgi:hypothetical protein